MTRLSTISGIAIVRLPQVETIAKLEPPPSLHETITAVQKLCSGNVPGSDTIPAEIHKHASPQIVDHLTSLFQEMRRRGEVPQDFKAAKIVHLYKPKVNLQFCDNHRGISLLNIAGKIFAHILISCVNEHMEQGLLQESQCGFRRHRGTTDIIFAARQLQKCHEMRTHLHSTFAHLRKVFEKVHREELWKLVQKFGCPEQFTQMVHQLHNGMTARVTDTKVVSEAFAVTKRVKQRCVLVRALFSLMRTNERDERPGSASPTERTANYSTTGGCTSDLVYPQLPSINFSSPTAALSTPPRKGTCKAAWDCSPPSATTLS
nr:unnamed protein product [Spirometra erinaceieuropaei]